MSLVYPREKKPWLRIGFIGLGLLLPISALLLSIPREVQVADPMWPTPTYRGENRVISDLFDPALAATRLDEPHRDRWQQPDQLVRALGLKPGETVADIGAGSGYLMRRLSRAVGRQGAVYAEEIQPDFLPMLRRRARLLGNVNVVLGTASDPRLPSGKVDLFVLLTVYHEVQKPVAFLQQLRSLAKPTTRLAIIDFDRDRKGDFPAPPDHELPETAVLAEAGKAGWELDSRYEFLGSQFFLVFKKASAAQP